MLGASSSQPEWQEGVGSLLLLAGASETALLSSLKTALTSNLSTADPSLRIARSQLVTLQCLLLTLLFLQAVGLRRTWDLRGYTGKTLALLTGRHQAYGYRHTERFLAELASIGADTHFTEALARWTASLWKPETRGELSVPVFYVDGHRKPVYADALIPRGLIGRTGKSDVSHDTWVLHTLDTGGEPNSSRNTFLTLSVNVD